MNLGWASLAGLGLIVGLWLYAHKNAPRLTTFLFLNGGTLFGGALGVLIGTAFGSALIATSSAGTKWIGIGTSTIVIGLALVATLEVVIKGMSPFKKWKANPKRWHPWLALVLPFFVALAGAPLLTNIVDFFTPVGSQIGGIAATLGR